MEKLELYYIDGRGTATLENNLAVSQKAKHKSYYMRTENTGPNKNVHMYVHSRVFVIGKKWKQPKRLTNDD